MDVLTRDAAPFLPHRLHGADRTWPETNCYVDLWIELLAFLGECPEAAFGFTVAQDYRSDQFTFSKIPSEDLRRLYGIEIGELSVWRSLEEHISTHVARRDVVLLEVDAFHLPDTEATAYRRKHTKTTIAVDAIDRVARTCSYFHNATRGMLAADDYLGAFRLRPEFLSEPDLLPPYVEIVSRRGEGPPTLALRDTAFDLLRHHLRLRPARNPFTCWQEEFAAHLDELLAAPDLFHDYGFHFPRLAGSNAELLGSHLEWLHPELAGLARLCERSAQTAKVLQFRLARSVSRRRIDLCGDCFLSLQDDYEAVLDGLARFLS